MVCSVCGSTLQKKTGRYEFRDAGLSNVVLDEWEAFVCGEGHAFPTWPNPDRLMRFLTRKLVTKPAPLSGDEIRFLRRAMALKSTEFADVLGVSRQEVSRWENDRNTISRESDLRLRRDAIDTILGDVPADFKLAVQDITLEARQEVGNGARQIMVTRYDLENVDEYSERGDRRRRPRELRAAART